MYKLRLVMALLAMTIFNQAVFASSTTSPAQPTVKEWTFLVFLNGNNNLDRFGSLNINQMETVGSTDDINIVVQWASYSAKKVQRLYVQKDFDETKVTSPVIEDMGKVDMGDWRNVVEFVKWAKERYPAKHYFIDMWDHGSGWHELMLRNLGLTRGLQINPLDISWDDFTGNHITTKQLGQAMAESAKVLGQKVDLYGSDACLMAMAEVADEMADSVDVSVGSQEVEPGPGWPYDTFMARWAPKPTASPSDVAKFLTEEYVKSYSGGTNGTQDVTFSAFDLSKTEQLNLAMANLGMAVQKFSAAEKKKFITAAKATQSFTYSDYNDLLDFLDNLEKAQISALGSQVLSDVRAAASEYIVVNQGTQMYRKATGLSIWVPRTKYSYDDYSALYGTMKFHEHTKWGDALKAVYN